MTQRFSRSARALTAAIAFAVIALSVSWLSGVFTARAQDATGFLVDQAVVVNTDGLNLRDDASSSAGVIQVLPEGTYGVILSGPITDSEYSWYLIEVDGLSGYVAGEFLADAGTDGAIAIGATVYVVTDALNLRDDASLTGNVVAELSTNTVATVLDGPITADGYDWYQLDVDGVTGWAVRDFLAFSALDDTSVVGAVAEGLDLFVNTDSLNVRDVAGVSGSVIEIVYSGESVTTTGLTETVDGYDWTQIQTAIGNTGWVVSSYLSADSTDLLMTIGTVAFVDTDVLNLRDSASISGSILAELVTGEEVTILSASEAADGYLWYQVDTAYGTGWLVSDFLSV